MAEHRAKAVSRDGLIERSIEHAVFGGEIGRREFIRRVGATTATSALASVFPMEAARAIAQDRTGPIEKKDLKIGFIPIGSVGLSLTY